ncbi:hypothetical protein SPI_06885 [Niveomyces insectorum RCEF 264]|uniref:Uncharacterized protein n=1 Tax=Niveomyces insectorum RCEF 264 TaxID=1081102 RepID=A0A167QVD4_9HYPO|nr:hypothetical protein SPI_06885 [Niveomyces insectorum RCEF 264]
MDRDPTRKKTFLFGVLLDAHKNTINCSLLRVETRVKVACRRSKASEKETVRGRHELPEVIEPGLYGCANKRGLQRRPLGAVTRLRRRGLGMEAFRPCPVKQIIAGATVYKDDPNSVTLPHFAGEWMGRGKDMEKATMQGCYVGVALVYARNQAL